MKVALGKRGETYIRSCHRMPFSKCVKPVCATNLKTFSSMEIIYIPWGVFNMGIVPSAGWVGSGGAGIWKMRSGRTLT